MIGKCVLLIAVVGLVISVRARPEISDKYDDRYMHPRQSHKIVSRSIDAKAAIINEEENHATFWIAKAQQALSDKLLHRPNTNVAKNVIMFLGDGLSVPTLKAARIYLGQLNNETGEDVELSFEKFPYVGLSKTYCVDKQVPDSACTATAYLGGVKNNDATIGVTGAVKLQDCDASLIEENRVESIAKWSQVRNKNTGLVTTTRVTHASPAGVYAHTADRDWESDADGIPSQCKDIAYQLIHSEIGKNLKVIMGGGRRKFLPNDVIDEEGDSGTRIDGENLIETWINSKEGKKAHYVWNRTALLDVPSDTEYLLGLFESDHCKYHLEADENEPSLAEMTEKAIQVLSSGENGYFLFVEGGRIDHAHHDTKAQKALDETVEFHKAIQRTIDITNEQDTLIVVTADHAHVMTVNGYPDRGNDIFGLPGIADDELPYTTLSYANGPGFQAHIDGKRQDVSKQNRHDKDYMFPAMVPLEWETHGGDDVAIFSHGPWAHLLTGVVEQNAIPHIMAYASCVGDGLTVCDQDVHRSKKSLSST